MSFEERHNISLPRLVSGGDDDPVSGPSWVVDIFRKGVEEPIDSVLINEKTLPPRIRRGKVVWKLPADTGKLPTFFSDEQKRILDIFKEQKKNRKKEKKAAKLSDTPGDEAVQVVDVTMDALPPEAGEYPQEAESSSEDGKSLQMKERDEGKIYAEDGGGTDDDKPNEEGLSLQSSRPSAESAGCADDPVPPDSSVGDAGSIVPASAKTSKRKKKRKSKASASLAAEAAAVEACLVTEDEIAVDKSIETETTAVQDDSVSRSLLPPSPDSVKPEELRPLSPNQMTRPGFVPEVDPVPEPPLLNDREPANANANTESSASSPSPSPVVQFTEDLSRLNLGRPANGGMTSSLLHSGGDGVDQGSLAATDESSFSTSSGGEQLQMQRHDRPPGLVATTVQHPSLPHPHYQQQALSMPMQPPDAQFITIPEAERPQLPLPSSAGTLQQPSVAIPAAKAFVEMYYAHLNRGLVSELARYYTPHAQKSISVGGAHSVVTGRQDISVQISSLAGANFMVRGVVSQDTPDGRGAHVLVTGLVQTALLASTTGTDVSMFAHSVSLAAAPNAVPSVTGFLGSAAVGASASPFPHQFQIHNDALSLLNAAAEMAAAGVPLG